MLFEAITLSAGRIADFCTAVECKEAFFAGDLGDRHGLRQIRMPFRSLDSAPEMHVDGNFTTRHYSP